MLVFLGKLNADVGEKIQPLEALARNLNGVFNMGNEVDVADPIVVDGMRGGDKLLREPRGDSRLQRLVRDVADV